jgi:sugar-specific transcriptional regulator TrmB
MEEKIKEFLKSIGLGKNEAEIYLALLRKEASSVLEISKITKIHRSNIYDSLNNLINHGLVYEINTNKRKLFYARPLKSLLDYVKHKEIELKEIINSFEVVNPIDRKVGISKGKFALKQALMSLLESGEPIVVYGIPNSAIETIGPILKEFHKERIKRKILMRHIYNQNAQERIKQLNKMKYTEARHLSEKYDSFVSTNIVKDKVILIIWDKEISVIEITDKNIAQAYKNYSEILWKKAKAD